MARYSRRTVYLLLLAIVLISLVLRYPLVGQERHNDTYFAHFLADSIKYNDRAVWTFNPLSYFGYYPASYPSGTSFLTAEFSDLSGLEVNLVILLEGFIVGVLFALAAFCLARQFKVQIEYSLLVAFLSSLAPRFVDNSYWNGGARAPFVALAITFVMIAVKASSSRQPLLYTLAPILLIGCFAFHHMAVLFLLFGAGYLLSVVIYRVSSRNSPLGKSRLHRRAIASVILLSTALSVILVSVLFLDYFEKEVIKGFEKTSLFDIEPAFLSAILNIAASYVSQIGFILVFGIVGIPMILRKGRVSSELLFCIALLIVFVPLLANALYISMLLTPFVVILGVTWLKQLLDGPRRRLASVTVVVLITASLMLPVWAVDRWNNVQELSGDTVEGNPQTFNDGAYVSLFRGDAQAISNVDMLGRRLSAVSGVVFLWAGVESAISGDATRESIEKNLTWGDQDFPKNLYLWFKYEEGQQVDWLVPVFYIQGGSFTIGERDEMSTGRDYYEMHSHLLVVVDNRWTSDYVWVWGILPAKLPSELSNAEWHDDGGIDHPMQSYLVYRSNGISLFALEAPNS